MQADEEKRNAFIEYYRTIVRKKWFFANKEVEQTILSVILCHKGSQLDVYIRYFKAMIYNIDRKYNIHSHTQSDGHPIGSKYVDAFIGPGETSRDYSSNYNLRLHFKDNEIYKFEVLN